MWNSAGEFYWALLWFTEPVAGALRANKRPHIFYLIGVTRASRSQRAFVDPGCNVIVGLCLVSERLVRCYASVCTRDRGCSKSGWSFSCNSIRVKF